VFLFETILKNAHLTTSQVVKHVIFMTATFPVCSLHPVGSRGSTATTERFSEQLQPSFKFDVQLIRDILLGLEVNSALQIASLL
jgi:hypothetical protein